MPFEQVGQGYSAGSQPDIAALVGQIQGQYGQRFNEYTNPFLNAKGIQGEVLPWMQQALEQKQQAATQSYQQGMLGVDQARQQMAQTAQNTILPLQASQLDAQTKGIQAQGAQANFNLTQAKGAASQAAGFYADAAQLAPGDTQGLLALSQKYPAFTTSQDGRQAVNTIYQDFNQKQNAKMQYGYQAAFNTGAAQAFDIPEGQTLTDTLAAIPKPGAGSTPQEQAEYSAKVDGMTKTYTGQQQAQLVNNLKMANTQIQTTGKIDAALYNSLKGSFGKNMSPTILAAAGVDPATASKIQAALAAAPDNSGSAVPDKTRVANLNVAKAIIQDANATTIEKNWAYSTLNTDGQPAFQLPVYQPETQDQIDLLNKQIGDLRTSLPSRGKTSMFGPSDYDQTMDKINALQQQLINTKNKAAANQAAAPAPSSAGTDTGIAPTEASPNFQESTNRFLPPTTNFSHLSGWNGPAAPASPILQFNQSQLQNLAPAATAAQKGQAPVAVPDNPATNAANAMPTLSPEHLSALDAAVKAHPNSPHAAQAKAILKYNKVPGY